MFEKVNPMHPDKVADRIAGAIVDLAYTKEDNPKVAVEVLIGHGVCHIIAETSVQLSKQEVSAIVNRIAKEKMAVDLVCVPQDAHLSRNQNEQIKCGDNGIFKGVPTSLEQYKLARAAQEVYAQCPYDGKYILAGDKYTFCQSNADAKTKQLLKSYPDAIINPLGDWTGGCDVDTGATNRKLGSDMGDAVTGGGLHGKDLSKADVSVNIYLHLKAQRENKTVYAHCAIGDKEVCGIPYSQIVKEARQYIKQIGGFEKLAEWGLIR